MKKVVMLGGGYGGYTIATQIERELSGAVEMILIDKHPRHFLKTEFYALAAGTVPDEKMQKSFPLGITVREGVVRAIDLDEKEVVLEDESIISYDYLVIGLGCEDNRAVVKGAQDHTTGVQDIDSVHVIKERVASLSPSEQVTIIGAGLTGIELASEIKEGRPDLSVRLLNRGERLLPHLSPSLSRYVEKWFSKKGVDVRHGVSVQEVTETSVQSEGESWESDLTIWAGGVMPNGVVQALAVEKDRSGRVVLDRYYRIPDHQDVFVVGDCASLPASPSAQVAKAQGKQIAAIVCDLLTGKDPTPPKGIKAKGVIGALGKRGGFGCVFGCSVTGPLARLLKSGVVWVHKWG